MASYDKSDIERRMNGAVEALKSDLGGLRTGRANVTLLDPVQVEVYGAMMPLNQVATVSAPEPRMLSVQVWDKSNITPVEKGIARAGLGLNAPPALLTSVAVVVTETTGSGAAEAAPTPRAVSASVRAKRPSACAWNMVLLLASGLR